MDKLFLPFLQEAYNRGYLYIARQGEDSCHAESALSLYTEKPSLVEKYDYWDINDGEELIIPHILFPEITFESGIIFVADVLKKLKEA